MAKIKNTIKYVQDLNITDNDYLIGTDADSNKVTKNFRVGGLLSYFESRSNLIGQNNVVVTISYQGLDGNFYDRVETAVNSNNPFTVAATEIYIISNTYIDYSVGSFAFVTNYYLFKAGVGVYGLGETLTTADDFFFLRGERREGLPTIGSLTPRVETIIATDINDPSDAVNTSLDSYNIISNRDTFFIIVENTASIPAPSITYRFVGALGSYGFGGLTAVPSDFILVEDNSIITPPAALTNTSQLINDGQNGTDPFITANDIPPSGVQSVQAGTNVSVDNTDPQNPVVSASGVQGSGTVNTLPVFTPNGTTLGDSRISQVGTRETRVTNPVTPSLGVSFFDDPVRWLRLFRTQSSLHFTLGNPDTSEENEVVSSNAFGTSIKTGGFLRFVTNVGTEALRLLSNGKLQITQTPDTGTTADKVLLRDTSGNVKQIDASALGGQLIRQEFTFTAAPQTFTLSSTVSLVFGVFVQGQELNSSQYTASGTTLTILDTLVADDKVNIIYSAEPVLVPSLAPLEIIDPVPSVVVNSVTDVLVKEYDLGTFTGRKVLSFQVLTHKIVSSTNGTFSLKVALYNENTTVETIIFSVNTATPSQNRLGFKIYGSLDSGNLRLVNLINTNAIGVSQSISSNSAGISNIAELPFTFSDTYKLRVYLSVTDLASSIKSYLTQITLK